jgi:hypothetical protein
VDEESEAEKMATLHHYMADPAVRRRAWQTRLDMRAAGQRRMPAIAPWSRSNAAASCTR